MKQAYEEYVGEYCYQLREIEVLPHCKSVTKYNYTTEYQLVRRKVLGFIPWTYWTDKKDIRWYNIPVIKYYDCSCGDKDE